MKLYRLRLVPESPWRTPWQSDTLAGLLCWMCARTEGDAVLRREIIEPALAGCPPFILSDAFPGDWLPVPITARLAEWAPKDRKVVKRARWLSADAFRRAQHGECPSLDDLVPVSGIHEYARLRNTIGRPGNATAHAGGLFQSEETVLGTDERGQQIEHLTVYVRVRDEFAEHFQLLMQELAECGFGADRSAGMGQFHLSSQLEPVKGMDAPNDADGFVVLSTFQPAPNDPTEGAWDSFTKYGKLGPDFGLENVFKRPLVLFRPGACFRHPLLHGWLGRAIPMRELLAPEEAVHLNARGASVVHWAFGLCVPLRWPLEKRGVPG